MSALEGLVALAFLLLGLTALLALFLGNYLALRFDQRAIIREAKNALVVDDQGLEVQVRDLDLDLNQN